MKAKKILALLISGVFATTMASQAAVITMPSGLSHGDQYRIVFVTSTTIQATSSDISTYNAHVTAAAALNPDLAVIEGTVERTTTWTAWALQRQSMFAITRALQGLARGSASTP